MSVPYATPVEHQAFTVAHQGQSVYPIQRYAPQYIQQQYPVQQPTVQYIQQQQQRPPFTHPKVCIRVPEAMQILQAELGPNWGSFDSYDLKDHLQNTQTILRAKYADFFQDCASTPYAGLSYQWGSGLGDIIGQLNGSLAMRIRGLRVEYFWLDILCLDETSEQATSCEMPHVASIYRDAALHVVSAAANLNRAWVLFEVRAVQDCCRLTPHIFYSALKASACVSTP